MDIRVCAMAHIVFNGDIREVLLTRLDGTELQADLKYDITTVTVGDMIAHYMFEECE